MPIVQRRQLPASSLNGHIQLKEILEYILRQGGSARVEALQMNLNGDWHETFSFWFFLTNKSGFTGA